MTSIIDDRYIVRLGNSLDRSEIAVVSKYMNRHDGHGMAGNLFLNLTGVDIQGLRIYIHKHRRAVLPHDGTDRSDESKWRRNDFASFSQSLDSHLQSEGAVATTHHIGNLQVLTDLLFKSLNKRSVMGHYTTFPNTFHQLVDFVKRSQGRHCHINGFSHISISLYYASKPDRALKSSTNCAWFKRV